jgi:hypothetical protein
VAATTADSATVTVVGPASTRRRPRTGQASTVASQPAALASTLSASVPVPAASTTIATHASIVVSILRTGLPGSGGPPGRLRDQPAFAKASVDLLRQRPG